MASEGPVYQLAISGVSDEWLLDKQASGAEVGVALGASSSTVLSNLANRLAPGTLNTSALSGGRAVGVFDPQAGAAFSEHAGVVANTTYSAYRALNGALNLTPGGNVVHTFSDGDGTLSVAALKTSSVRELANDVTVSGEMESTVYWTELFQGDGTTTVFELAGQPDAPNANHATLIYDDFTGGTFNRQLWEISDSGSHLGLGGGGLVMTGGTGYDGQTTVTAYDQLELGGTIVFEIANLALNAGSAGVLAGLVQRPDAADELLRRIQRYAVRRQHDPRANRERTRHRQRRLPSWRATSTPSGCTPAPARRRSR